MNSASHDPRRHAPATQRNKEPIADVLERWLPPVGTVLEIASGTGEHAVHFSNYFPALLWQPSDPSPKGRDSIEAYAGDTGHDRILPPLDISTTDTFWTKKCPDDLAAIVCINMIHIAPYEAALGLFRGAAEVLPAGAPLILYGPFTRDGQHTAPSNADFDASLQTKNPTWGVRNLETVIADAAIQGLEHVETTEMPANNLMVLFRNGK